MLGAALYFIDGKNMIQTIMIDGRPKNMNTGSFINKGFEIEGAWQITNEWTLSANYSYLHTDAAINYAPKNKLNAELLWTPGNFRLNLEETSIWSMYTGNPSQRSSYTLLNLGCAYTFTSTVPLTLITKLDNITNKHYEIMYGCPMPGFTIMGGIEIKF